MTFTFKLQQGGELGHGFNSPDPSTHKVRESYLEYLQTHLPPESPLIYGLHMNSEIAYLNTSTTTVMSTVLRLKAGSQAGAGNSTSASGGSDELIEDLLGRLPEQFDIIDANDKAAALITGKDAPYIVVLLQELSRMNGLTAEVARSLEELRKGLLGQLNMSQKMEDLLSALSIGQVPGRNPFHSASWEKYAWPSMKNLSSWFADVIIRCEQLTSWVANEGLQSPHSMWLPGLFNPTAFLTAIKQVTARNDGLPLDTMTIETHVSALASIADVSTRLVEGAYIHGLFCEGELGCNTLHSSSPPTQVHVGELMATKRMHIASTPSSAQGCFGTQSPRTSSQLCPLFT